MKNTTPTDRSPPLQDRGTKDYNTGAEGRHLTHMKASRNMTQRKWHVSCQELLTRERGLMGFRGKVNYVQRSRDVRKWCWEVQTVTARWSTECVL